MRCVRRADRCLCAALVATLLCAGCDTPDELADEHRAKVTAQLEAMKKICAAWKKDAAPTNAAKVKKAKLPEELIVMTPSEGRKNDHNTLLMDGDWCPKLKILIDDKKKKLGQSSLSVGFAFPLAHMADVYWRKDKYRFERYEKDTSEMEADIRGVENLRYAILWGVDELKFPLIDEKKQTFKGGSFRGRFLVYRLRDAKLLSSVTVKSKNRDNVSVSHGEKTITRTEEKWDARKQRNVYREQTQQLNLGTFVQAAQRDLMMDLTFATHDAAAKAIPFRDAKSTW